MPDISKCSNEDCPVKEKCYRYKCPPDWYFQSYADFKPDEDGICLDFMPIYERNNPTK